jgi:hypothetical protein
MAVDRKLRYWLTSAVQQKRIVPRETLLLTLRQLSIYESDRLNLMSAAIATAYIADDRPDIVSTDDWRHLAVAIAADPDSKGTGAVASAIPRGAEPTDILRGQFWWTNHWTSQPRRCV